MLTNIIIILYFINKKNNIFIIFILFLILILFFFRDYNINELICKPNNVILSPANGIIKNIIEDNNTYIITIYLSLLDKHVQCNPINGFINKQKYTCGNFNPAFLPDKSSNNERLETWINTNYGDMKITQYAGLLARRIISFHKENDFIKKGEPFGLILFSSRVDIKIPKKNLKLNIKINDYLNLGDIIGLYNI
jgi:phosphatidylserine decarboxylase